MSCIDLSISAPQIPMFFLGLPGFNFVINFPPTPPTIGISCCHFTLPGITIPVSIPPIGFPPEIYQAFIIAMNMYLNTIIIPLTIPACPGNGTQL